MPVPLRALPKPTPTSDPVRTNSSWRTEVGKWVSTPSRLGPTWPWAGCQPVRIPDSTSLGQVSSNAAVESSSTAPNENPGVWQRAQELAPWAAGLLKISSA